MSNIGNISGPQGQIPQKRIDTLDTQRKPADKSDSKAAPAPQAGDTADVQRDATLLAKAREAFEKSQAIREDRIAEVTERLKSGFYDRPEVIEALASGLARGLRA
jgi:hypothetical protein